MATMLPTVIPPDIYTTGWQAIWLPQTKSTILIIHVNGGTVEFGAYRDTHDGVYDYIDIIHYGRLTSKIKALQ